MPLAWAKVWRGQVGTQLPAELPLTAPRRAQAQGPPCLTALRDSVAEVFNKCAKDHVSIWQMNISTP